MLDQTEQLLWFEAYLMEGLKVAPKRYPKKRIVAWAKSMSLIAEQFYDDDDRELVECDT